MLNILKSLTALKPEDMIPGEEILVDRFQSWWVELKNVFIAIATLVISVFLFVYNYVYSDGNLLFLSLSILFFIMAFFLALMLLFSHYSTRYFLTSERILTRNGIFTKHIRAVPYEKIQDTQLKKTFFENVADIGDILINSAGGDEVELKIENIEDPEKFYTLILEKMKSKRETL